MKQDPSSNNFSYKKPMKVKRSNFWVRRSVHFQNAVLRYYKSDDDRKVRFECDLTKYKIQVQRNRAENPPLMIVTDNKYNIA